MQIDVNGLTDYLEVVDNIIEENYMGFLQNDEPETSIVLERLKEKNYIEQLLQNYHNDHLPLNE